MVKTPIVLSVKVANEIEAVGAGTTAAVLPVTDLIVAFVVFGVKRIPTGDIAFIIRVRGLFAVAVIENDAVNISGDIEGILRFVVIIVACGRNSGFSRADSKFDSISLFFYAIARLCAFIYSSATARCSLRYFSNTEQ